MNRKKRRLLLAKRRNPPPPRPTPASLALAEVMARANGKGESFVRLQMQLAGFLPNGSGGWRPMTEHEKEMWNA